MAFESDQFRQLFASCLENPTRPNHPLVAICETAQLARNKPLEQMLVEQKVQYQVVQEVENQTKYSLGDILAEHDKNDHLVDQIIHKYVQAAILSHNWSDVVNLLTQPPWVVNLKDAQAVDLDRLYQIIMYYRCNPLTSQR